jgi:uncharacterized protein (DUF433 family)
MCHVAREHFSMRLPEDVRKRLTERSRETGASESELARRYVSEGIRRDLHPAITMRPGRVGGRPALASRPRLEVAVIVETWMDNDRDTDATLRAHDLTTPDLEAALAYYADFQHEIDETIQRKRDLFERHQQIYSPPTRRR